jgi:hypothetical protein
MESIITIAPTPEQLADKALRKIIDDSLILLRELEWDKWRVYEVGKEALRGFYPTPDSYQRAVRALAEALNI